MVGTDLSVPVFIPPRKRQTTKKSNGTQNYVDHIVSVSVDSLYTKQNHIFELLMFRVAQSSLQRYQVPMIAL